MPNRKHIPWRRIWDQTRSKAHKTVMWCERRPGTGSWVGAIGAVVAIFVAYGLAHSEYMRTVDAQNERVNSFISLVSRSANEFDPLVQQYIHLVRSNDPAAKNFYNNHINDIAAHHMYDLVNMPITVWPTVESYDAFKGYWFPANNLLTSSGATNKVDPEPLIKACEGKLETLQKALDAARK